MRLVDNKGLGKPDKFAGEPGKFLPWKIKTTSYLVSIRKELRDVLAWRAGCNQPITDLNIDATFGHAADELDRIDNIQELRRELWDVLLMLTEKEPLILISS